MVTQIQLGNFYQQNGRTVIGGSQSGIDTEGLINALADAKRLPATRLEDKIKLNDSKTTALTKLKDILSRFKDAADLLRNPPGVSNSSKNIFAYRTTSLSTNTGAVAGNYLSVTAQPGAQIQNLTINDIESLARETKQDTGDITIASASDVAVANTPTAGMLTAGTISIRNVKAGDPDISLTIGAGDSLNTVASKFNAVKDKTGIQATVIKVADGTFKLVFAGTKTGVSYGFDMGDAGTVTSDPDGVFASIGINAPSQTAQNAKFTINNVVVEREQNTVNDLIDGLSFTLKAVTPNDGTEIGIAVQPDEDIVKNAIVQFADAYNEFRLFATQQAKVKDDGTADDGAVLSTNQALRTAISRVGSEISAVVNGLSGGDPSRLADIGLDFTDFAGDDTNPYTRNIIQINEEKLASALAGNFEGVAGLFQFQMSSDNPALTVFKRSNNVSVSQFTLNIDRLNGVYTANYIDSNGSPQVANFTATPISGGTGITLKAEDGSALAGLEFIFASAADTATIGVNINQGIGDRLYNALDTLTNTNGGVVTNELETIADANGRYKTEITRIDDQVARYREQLVAQYASLEAALTRANQLLQMLDAQQQARNSN